MEDVGLLEPHHAVQKPLKRDGSRLDVRGHRLDLTIVDISSSGGRNGGPFLGAYVTSKHGLGGYSDTLRHELMLYGIDVIIVWPGSVDTAIWDRAETNDTSAFDGTDYGRSVRNFKRYMIREGRKGLAPEVVGRTVWRARTARRPNGRYAPVPKS